MHPLQLMWTDKDCQIYPRSDSMFMANGKDRDVKRHCCSKLKFAWIMKSKISQKQKIYAASKTPRLTNAGCKRKNLTPSNVCGSSRVLIAIPHTRTIYSAFLVYELSWIADRNESWIVKNDYRVERSLHVDLTHWRERAWQCSLTHQSSDNY